MTGIKVGDYVRNEKFGLKGVVEKIQPCFHKCGKEEIILKDQVTTGHLENFEVIQRVWRTLSTLPNGMGYLVWIVWEVVGHEGEKPSYFEESADGGFIMQACTHFFTREKALDYLTIEPIEERFQVMIDIPEKKED